MTTANILDSASPKLAIVRRGYAVWPLIGFKRGLNNLVSNPNNGALPARDVGDPAPRTLRDPVGEPSLRGAFPASCMTRPRQGRQSLSNR